MNLTSLENNKVKVNWIYGLHSRYSLDVTKHMGVLRMPDKMHEVQPR